MIENPNWKKHKKRLLQLKAELEEKIALRPDIIDYGESEEVEADETVAADIQAGVKGNLKARLEDVKSALNKIQAGNYGLCEVCQNPIEDKILEIDPESRYCLQHKK